MTSFETEGIARPERGAWLLTSVAFIVFTDPVWLAQSRGLTVVCYSLVVLLVIAWRISIRRRLQRPPILIGLFLFLCVASLVWSDSPSDTIDACIDVAFPLIAGWLIASGGSLRTMALGVSRGALVALAASIALSVVSPTIGLVVGRAEAGSLVGIYSHRNILASALVFGLCAALAQPGSRGAPAIRKGLAIIALTGGIVATSSATALVIVVAMFGFALLIALVRRFELRWRYPAVVIVSLFAVVAAILIVNQLDAVLAIVGRDSTLTNRTEIWQLAGELISRRPLLGYGWGAVWGEPNLVGAQISAAIDYQIYHAHNDSIDVALKLGIVGAALLVFTQVSTTLTGLKQSIENSKAATVWVPLTMVALLVYGISETRASQPLGIFFIALFCAAQRAIRMKLARQRANEVDRGVPTARFSRQRRPGASPARPMAHSASRSAYPRHG